MKKYLLMCLFFLLIDPFEAFTWERHSIGNLVEPLYLIVDDIDEDGYLDVAAGSVLFGDGVAWAPSEVAWFKNTGISVFMKRVIFPNVAPPEPIHNAQGLAVADFDRDGQNDIAVASGRYATDQGRVHWFKSPPAFQDSFWTHFEVLPETTSNSFFKIYTIDANEDLWPDLVVGGNHEASIFLNPTNPALGEAWEQVPLEPSSGSTLNLADVNHDGKIDILNTMLRTYFTSQPIDITDQGSGNHTITNDANGTADTLVPSDIDTIGDTITVNSTFYANCESGNVSMLSTTGTLPNPLSSSFEYYIIKTGSANMIQLAKRSGEVSWFNIINNGGAVNVERTTIDPDIMMPFDTDTMDINGDVFPDVVTSTFIPEQGIYWYENPGSGGGQWVKNVISPDFEGSDIYAGDINYDGQDDLVSSALFFNKLSWFEYEWVAGTAVWTEHVVDPNINMPGDISLNDIDGDKDLDIVVHAVGDGEVIWYENTLVTIQLLSAPMLALSQTPISQDQGTPTPITLGIGDLITWKNKKVPTQVFFNLRPAVGCSTWGPDTELQAPNNRFGFWSWYPADDLAPDVTYEFRIRLQGGVGGPEAIYDGYFVRPTLP